MIELYDLKTLHMRSPVTDMVPYFSWKIKSSTRDTVQKSYRIRLIKQGGICAGSKVHGESECREENVPVWDSGTVFSDQQSFVMYEGPELISNTAYRWTVTIFDNHGQAAECDAYFITAVLDRKEWKAKWAECPFVREPANEYKFGNSYPAVMFEQEIVIEKTLKNVFVYATAHGVYRLTVNGMRPDDREMAPEFTPYDRILYYQKYDLTGLLKKGRNTLEMFVADGWYFSAQAGPVMPVRHREPSVLFQLYAEYEDGSRDIICSDNSMTCRTEYIVYSDLYQGEKQDFTISSGSGQKVIVKDYGYDMLRCQPMPGIKAIETIEAAEVFISPKGETIVDFGQILAGRARINIDIPFGQEVVFEYFEILDKDGNYINTMFAPQKDTYISDGKPRVYEALFTFHGFRYIRVTGMERVRREDFRAVLLSTEKDNAGSFVCSDERLNRLYKNIRYSQYNNMMSVPTDCPSREKAGWTGDILIYARTAMMNEDMTPFLENWLNLVRADQMDDGVVTIVSPFMNLYKGLLENVCKGFGDDRITGVAGWSDAIVWVPYDMYQVTGNKRILEENYEAMEAWAGYIIRTAAEKRGEYGIPGEYDKHLWNTGFHFGEWLIPGRKAKKGEGPYDACRESAYYIAPFFGYMTIWKMSEIAACLGKNDRAAYYAGVASDMKHAIQKGIFDRGLMPDRYMGAYVIAFAFDLVPEERKAEYKKRILDLIEKNGGCLDTGFLATPFILDVLCKLGETEQAYKLLWQDKMPSWLYEVDHGATAIWEAWEADEARENGRFVSFDHYAFGCVDSWICRHIAGIDSKGPGFKHIIIKPDMQGTISFCRRTFECEAGTISVSWDMENLKVDIPCNTRASIYWKGHIYEAGSGEYEFG